MIGFTPPGGWTDDSRIARSYWYVVVRPPWVADVTSPSGLTTNVLSRLGVSILSTTPQVYVEVATLPRASVMRYTFPCAVGWYVVVMPREVLLSTKPVDK